MEQSDNKEHSYLSDFKYTHKNPYHDRLEEYEDFVLRDEEAEKFCGSWNTLFENKNPVHLEIGSGYGKFMCEYSKNNPQINFIGMDFRFKRSFKLAKKLNEIPHKNFKYLRAKGERVGFIFGENEIEKIFYFFPDPWPKARQNKKRLFQKPFLDSAFKILKPQGEIIIKTDHDDYYMWMKERALKDDRYEILLMTSDLRSEYPAHFLASFETEFEKIFLGKGIKIKALVLKSKK